MWSWQIQWTYFVKVSAIIECDEELLNEIFNIKIYDYQIVHLKKSKCKVFYVQNKQFYLNEYLNSEEPK